MTKPRTRIADLYGASQGMPKTIDIHIPFLQVEMTDKLAQAILKPCLLAMAKTAIPMLELRNDKIVFEVSFEPGISSLLFDLEAVFTRMEWERATGPRRDKAIAALSQIIAKLEAGRPVKADRS